MHECAKYLMKRCQELDAGRLVFKNLLIDKDRHRHWDYCNKDKFPPNCAKHMIIGCENIYSWSPWYFSQGKSKSDRSNIYFTGLWMPDTSSWISRFDVVEKEEHLLDILDKAFMQMMTLSEQQDIYARDVVLFKQGSAYEHLMAIDLEFEPES